MSRSQYVLGVSAFYHDSAAAIVRGGEILAAAQEERFSRKKHDPRFPFAAINYCLEEAQIEAEEQIIHMGAMPIVPAVRIGGVPPGLLVLEPEIQGVLVVGGPLGRRPQGGPQPEPLVQGIGLVRRVTRSRIIVVISKVSEEMVDPEAIVHDESLFPLQNRQFRRLQGHPGLLFDAPLFFDRLGNSSFGR